MSKITRRSALKLAAGGSALAAAGLAAPSIVRAQEYPGRPITVVVPFAAGGYSDRLARVSAPFIQEKLGQPLNVINRTGGNSVLGHSYALQQPDDGYTILQTTTPYIPLSIMLHGAPYKRDDFHMINLPSRDFTLAATAASSDIKSFEQMLDMLKEDPRSVSIGVQPASSDYLNLMLVMQANDVDTDQMRIVTYDGGSPARNAAVGGQVDVTFGGAEAFYQMSDQITPLLVFNDEPVEWWPDVPVITAFAEEHGFEGDYVDGSQRGWVVSSAFRDGEPERYQTLLSAIEAASKDEEAVKTLSNQGLATRWYGPEASNQAYQRLCDALERNQQYLKT